MPFLSASDHLGIGTLAHLLADRFERVVEPTGPDRRGMVRAHQFNQARRRKFSYRQWEAHSQWSDIVPGRRRCQPQVGTRLQQTSKWLIKWQKVAKTQ
jgi:hypothetical protein